MTTLDELSCLLALTRSPMSYKTMRGLLDKFPYATELFHQPIQTFQAMQLSEEVIEYLQAPNWRGVEEDLSWREQDNNHFIITLNDVQYPALLKEISQPPLILFIKGNPSVLHESLLAMVGARNSTANGEENAFTLARNLSAAGLIIISGLAQGIDTFAHQGALEVSKTVAVVGTGINICYPKCNQKLAERICENGAIVSEFNINTPPLAQHFPRRNRLISGLSLGTLIVEANIKSGSLITANYALEQGREVFAVPGPITNPRTKGCHSLIKQGAKLVDCAEDVLEELGFLATKTAIPRDAISTPLHKRLDDDHRKLLECVGYEPTKIDVIVMRSHYSVQEVTTLLVDLELSGYISSSMNGYTRVS